MGGAGGSAKVIGAWVLVREVDLCNRVVEVVLFEVRVERDASIGHSHCPRHSTQKIWHRAMTGIEEAQTAEP